jgi:FkbM family methyltransferase
MFRNTRRSVTRAGRTYYVRDEYPHRAEDPSIEDWDFWSVFASGGWEPELEEVLRQHLTSESTFVDVGAWIGPVSLIAARFCRIVHAVEPDPVARERLGVNIMDLQNPGSIIVHPEAITDHDGLVRIGHRADRRFGDSMTSTIFQGDAISVRGVPLRTFVEAHRITDIGLIKMDIEGGEQAVLAECHPFLRDLGVPLLLSLHAPIVPNPTAYLQSIRESLVGFRTTLISGAWDGLSTVLVES